MNSIKIFIFIILGSILFMTSLSGILYPFGFFIKWLKSNFKVLVPHIDIFFGKDFLNDFSLSGKGILIMIFGYFNAVLLILSTVDPNRYPWFNELYFSWWN